MNPFHEINTIPLLAILLDATGKGLVLILLAWGVSRLLPRASAAGQHTVWTLAVVALLALPILSAALPQWQLPLLPEWAQYRQPVEEPGEELPAPTDSLSDETGSAGLPPREQIDELEEEPFSSRDNKSMAVLPEETDELSTMAQDVGARKRPRAPLLRSEAGPQVRAWPAWAVATWLAGAAVVLLPLMLGSFTAWRCVRRARPMTEGAWPALLGELADSLRLGRSVRLCQSAAEDIPAVFGLFHPTILVPACADDWSEQRRRVVLLHELAHVKRRDCLTQLLGQLACVLYWFNPLAWLIARQLRIERERACDDLVLSAGQKPSEYADHLLEMVRTLRSRACPSLAAVAMAKKSNFEHRLLAILDAARPRKALTKAATTVAFFAAVAVLLPLAMLHVTTKKDTKNSSRTSSLSDVPTTQPIHDIGFYIITSPESVGRASLASMENLKLAAKPFIGRDDIRYYDWKNHTIHLKLDMKKRFSALMKKRRPTVPFVVVADGRRLYVGMLMNPVSSEAYPDVPIICTELLPAETKRQNTIQIQHPPYKGHDRRDNKILKRVLGEMNLLKADDVPAPPAVRPTVQPTWKDGVLSVDVSNGARVGIVGVSKLGRRPRVWWRADGRKMDAAPYAGAKQKWRYQYEILLRRQADTEVEWIWDVPGAKLFKPGGTPKDKHGKALPNMQSLLVSYDGQRKTTNLRYAVSTGQWEQVLTIQPNPKNTAESNRDGYRLAVRKPARNGKNVEWTLEYTLPRPQATRVFAVTSDGKKVPPTSRTTWNTEEFFVGLVASTTATKGQRSVRGVMEHDTKRNRWMSRCEFPVPPERIKEFILETSSVRWVEIQNISLQPGAITGVKAISISMPKENIAGRKVREGKGVGNLTLGLTVQQVLDLLGQPDGRSDKPHTWLQYRQSRGIDILFPDGKAGEIRFNQGFKSTLRSGIGIGSTMEDVFKAYSRPIRTVKTPRKNAGEFDNDRVLCRLTDRKATKIKYADRGVLFWFDKNDKVNQFVVFPIQKPTATSQPAKKPAGTIQPVTRKRRFQSPYTTETEENKAAMEKLNKRLGKFELKHVEFAKAIDMLCDKTGLHIHVSWGALEVDDPHIRSAVVNLDLTDNTISTALRRLLNAAVGWNVLDFVVDDGVVTIDTRDKIQALTYPQVYDIRDLIAPDPRNQNASWVTCLVKDEKKRAALTQENLTGLFIQFIRKAVGDTGDYNSWHPDGNGQINELKGNLVITQTRENHREIAALLNNIRQNRSKRIFLPRKIVNPRLGDIDKLCGWMTLRLGWNGQKVFIPGPLYWSTEGRRTNDYQNWQRYGDVRTLQFTDSHGRQWKTKTLGLNMPQITVHRPDGTLLATGMVMENNRPSHWELYDATGKNKIFKALCRQTKTKQEKDTGLWYLAYFYTYDPDGTEHEWQISPNQSVVRGEMLNLPSGRSFYVAYARPYTDAPQPYTPKLDNASQISNAKTAATFMLIHAQLGNMDVVRRLVQPGSQLTRLVRQPAKLKSFLKGDKYVIYDHNVSIDGDRATILANRKNEIRTIHMAQTDDGHWLATNIDDKLKEVAVFYIMGDVKRPGAYTLTHRDVTVKMAIASAGIATGKNRPTKAILIRRIENNKEKLTSVDLEGILTGKVSDFFLKPNDILAVGVSSDFTRKQLPIRTNMLKPLKKGAEINGVVLQPDGKPADGATMMLTTYKNPGTISLPSQENHFYAKIFLKTRRDGKFSFTADGEPGKIVAYHDTGFAEVDQRQVKRMGKVQLESWGHLEGTLMIGDKPGGNETMNITRSLPDGRVETRMNFTASTKTDKNGRFRFDRVPPGTVRVARIVKKKDPMTGLTSHVPSISRIVDIHSNQTVETKLGGTGRPIVGRLVVPKDYKGKIDWAQGYSVFTPKVNWPQPPEPPNAATMSSAQKQAWLEEWKKTDKGKSYQLGYSLAWRKRRRFSFVPKSDGSFRVEDVPAGTYEFHARLYTPSEKGPVLSKAPIGELKFEFTVPEMSNGRSDEPLDIGTHKLIAAGEKKDNTNPTKGSVHSSASKKTTPAQQIWRGKVVDETNRAVPGATVAAYQATGDHNNPVKIVGKVTSDEHGNFTMSLPADAKPGRYSRVGYGQFVAFKDGKALDWHEPSLHPDKTEFLSFTLGEPRTLSGTVVNEKGRPIAGADVHACLNQGRGNYIQPPIDPMGNLTTKTDAQGRFQFHGIPAAAGAEFEIQADGYAHVQTRGSLSDDYQYSAGQENIRISLPQAAKIEGRVIDKETGKGVSGVYVNAHSFAKTFLGRKTGAMTDKEGRFVIVNALPGKTGLNVWPPSFFNAWEWIMVQPVNIQTQAGREEKDITIEVQRGLPVEIKVTNEKDQPISGASVRITSKGKNKFCPNTNADGMATAYLLPGEYQINGVGCDGYLARKLEISFVLKENQTRDFTVQLFKMPGITGVVRDPKGKPVQGAAVQLVGGSRMVTGPDGRFELFDRSDNPGSGGKKNAILARHKTRNLVAITTFPADKKSCDMTLTPGFTIRGRVISSDKKPLPHAQVRIEDIPVSPNSHTIAKVNITVTVDKAGRRMHSNTTTTAGSKDVIIHVGEQTSSPSRPGKMTHSSPSKLSLNPS